MTGCMWWGWGHVPWKTGTVLPSWISAKQKGEVTPLVTGQFIGPFLEQAGYRVRGAQGKTGLRLRGPRTACPPREGLF